MRQLLDNALKFSTHVAAPRIAVNSRMEGSHVKVFVSDNGCGFDMRFAGQLFRPLQRLHSAAEYDGAGMGLAIAQRIIGLHGGTMQATASPGEGARFEFSVRAASGGRASLERGVPW
jgi:light-regulated signal transduction histidine kinase (bacteriophytochrome)